MRKHKKRNHSRPHSAKVEAACRAGRQSFWTPFKVWKQSQCPVNANAQLAYEQDIHGTVPAPVPVQLCLCELPAYRGPAPHASQLDADITAAEVGRALLRAQCGKAAGRDGPPAQVPWPQLGKSLSESNLFHTTCPFVATLAFHSCSISNFTLVLAITPSAPHHYSTCLLQIV